MAQVVYGLDTDKLASDFTKLHIELTLVRRERNNLSYENSTTLYVALFLRGNVINRVPFRGLLDRVKIGTLAYKKYQDFLKLTLRALGYDVQYAEYEAVCDFFRTHILDILLKDLAVKRVITKNFPIVSPKDRLEHLLTLQDTIPDQGRVLYDGIVDDSSEDFLVYSDLGTDSSLEIHIYDKKTKQTTSLSVDQLWSGPEHLDIPLTLIPLPMRSNAVTYTETILVPALKVFSIAQYNKATEIVKLAGGIDLLNQELLRQQEAEYLDIIKDLEAEGIVIDGLDGMDIPYTSENTTLETITMADLTTPEDSVPDEDDIDAITRQMLQGTSDPAFFLAQLEKAEVDQMVDAAGGASTKAVVDTSTNPLQDVFATFHQDFLLSLTVGDGITLQLTNHSDEGFAFSLKISLHDLNSTNQNLVRFAESYVNLQIAKRRVTSPTSIEAHPDLKFDETKHTAELVTAIFNILATLKDQLP